jgi:hypothetical protein
MGDLSFGISAALTQFLNMNGTAMNDAKTPPVEKPEVAKQDPKKLPPEIGGQKGPEPTRYGDWEKNGRCTDF